MLFCPNMTYFYIFSWRNTKNQAFPNSQFCKRNYASGKFTNKKHEKPTLHSLIAKHVLEISIELKFLWKRFEEKQCFTVMVWIGYLIVFIKPCSHGVTLLCTWENETLWGLSSSPITQVLQTLAQSFIKLIHWALNKFLIELNRKLVQSLVYRVYYCIVKVFTSVKGFL